MKKYIISRKNFKQILLTTYDEMGVKNGNEIYINNNQCTHIFSFKIPTTKLYYSCQKIWHAFNKNKILWSRNIDGVNEV